MPDIREATSADMEDVRRLFREYVAWIGLDLSFQNFERELAELPGDYVAPKGTLLIARVDGLVAGCVAAHEWEIGVCEMKRLFVRDTARGTGCGRALVEKIIGWARDSGYASVLLDTLPVMDQAQNLYARLGFTDVPAYRPNPVPGARFLRLDLPR